MGMGEVIAADQVRVSPSTLPSTARISAATYGGKRAEF
jgi:hypothetical protein